MSKSSILPPPKSTRLVTIVAHVDHGKTTLADSLVEHNGIISERLAGTVRYLDSMEEEQRRGITIRSSAIGLKHSYRAHGNKQKGVNGGGGGEDSTVVVHLIDSPGHVDFSQEVLTALHLCDGALVMVDVVEGMCARMQSILRETYAQRLVPILVLNKVDRLCTDLGLTVEEGYRRLRGVIENVNAAASNLIRSSWADGDGGGGDNDGDNNDDGDNDNDNDGDGDGSTANERHGNTRTKSQTQTTEEEKNEELERIWTFDPALGNVVFASALYGWGFTVPSLARSLYRSKIVPNIKPPLLRQFLFADCRYDRDTGKLVRFKERRDRGGNGGDGEAMSVFAEFGLKPLWDIVTGVYTAAVSLGMTSELFSQGRSTFASSDNTDTTTADKDQHKHKHKDKDKDTRTKMKATTPGMSDLVLSSLQIGSTTPTTPDSATPAHLLLPTDSHDLQLLLDKTNASSETTVLRSLLRRHRSVSHAVLDAVCERCPDPREAAGGVRSEVLRLVEPKEDIDGGGGNGGGEQRRREFDAIQDGVRKCRTDDDDEGDEGDGSGVPTVAHVCKFVPTDRTQVGDPELFSLLDRTESETSTSTSISASTSATAPVEPKRNLLLGIARVLSGTLRASSPHYHCFGPKHSSSSSPSPHDAPLKPIRLYLLMGSSYVRVSSVPAGHICAVYGLEELQWKTVTLCDGAYGMPLKQEFDGRALRPLMKVNVEAVSACDTNILEKGLAKLSLADAAIEVTATSKGERILACQGEIHLEQSILDLETIYCAGGALGVTAASGSDGGGDGKKIELRISKPIVEFGESTEWFAGGGSGGGGGGSGGVGETADYVQFFDNGRRKNSPPPPPLRQVLIPPYCYEDGLGRAQRGRSRAIVSGRSVAVSVRVVPLSKWVYDRLKGSGSKDEKEGDEKMAESCKEDVLVLGRALGLTSSSDRNDNAIKGNLPENVILTKLKELLCSIDTKGNAMIESVGVKDGSCIKGVPTLNGEVYVPPPTVSNGMKAGGDKDGEGDAKDDVIDVPGKLEYDAMRDCIRNVGLGTKVNVDPIAISTNEYENDGKDSADTIACSIWKSEMFGSAVAGFHSSCSSGPLCEEPIRGILVILEGVEIALVKSKNKRNKRKQEPDNADTSNTNDAPPTPSPYIVPSLSGGMIITTLQTAIRSAFLTRPSRLVENHLRLTLHSSLTALGPLHSILSKRRGKVVSDTMVEGTDLLAITATLPQIESFGLGPELLKKSSGEVTAPELIFSHWERLEEDPFWIPTSLEEREDYGEILVNGDSSTGVGNNALKYIRMVRERKGLMVDSRIIVEAEKQRTLARKK